MNLFVESPLLVSKTSLIKKGQGRELFMKSSLWDGYHFLEFEFRIGCFLSFSSVTPRIPSKYLIRILYVPVKHKFERLVDF